MSTLPCCQHAGQLHRPLAGPGPPLTCHFLKARAAAASVWALTPTRLPLCLRSCDGVIVETEELHRRAYNAAFQAFGLTIDGQPVEWTVEYYVSAAGQRSGGGRGR